MTYCMDCGCNVARTCSCAKGCRLHPTAAQVTLRRSLEDQVSQALRPFIYSGAEDFVLQHGEWTTITECLPGIPQHCYQNAIGRAHHNGWEYVEGFALLPSPTDRFAISARPGAPINEGLDEPIPHAWVRDPKTGVAYEVTWPIPGRAYVGVVFSAVRADDATWNGDGSVLHDLRGDPLFRQPWTGETWHETDDSEALARLELAVALTGEQFDMSKLWAVDEMLKSANLIERE